MLNIQELQLFICDVVQQAEMPWKVWLVLDPLVCLIPQLLNPFCSSFPHIMINNCGGEMKTADASVSL